MREARKHQRAAWIITKRHEGFVPCPHGDILETAKRLSYKVALAPKNDIDEQDYCWLPSWLVELLQGDTSHADQLLPPSLRGLDPTERYLRVVEMILRGAHMNSGRMERFKLWLELTNQSQSSEQE
jgi:hypothetical protein